MKRLIKLLVFMLIICFLIAFYSVLIKNKGVSDFETEEVATAESSVEEPVEEEPVEEEPVKEEPVEEKSIEEEPREVPEEDLEPDYDMVLLFIATGDLDKPVLKSMTKELRESIYDLYAQEPFASHWHDSVIEHIESDGDIFYVQFDKDGETYKIQYAVEDGKISEYNYLGVADQKI